ncbi:MAG: SusD/RagB family nutrient-binding outer membrane lipoprotein, partial [Chitinophagaceae bacterium]
MKRYIFLILIAGGMLSSCQKMSYFQVNPNTPSQSPPSLILTYLCEQTFQEDPAVAGRACRYVTYYEVPDIYVQYNWAQGSFGDYDELRQVAQMEKEATRTNEPVYLSLAKFFKAYYYTNLSNTFGDVPFSESMLASQGNIQPRYDDQEVIIDSCLQLLDQANNELAEDKGTIDGDIIFNGNILQWRQMINAFRLRVLISLSKKVQEGSTKINVINQFKQIISDPSQYPLMNGIQDNGQFVFHDLDGNRYPDYNYRSMQTLFS